MFIFVLPKLFFPKNKIIGEGSVGAVPVQITYLLFNGLFNKHGHKNLQGQAKLDLVSYVLAL